MAKTLVLGNSHCQALKDALTGPPEGLELRWVRSGKPGAPGDISKEDALRHAAALGPEDRLVLLHLGTLHNVIGLLNADPPFSILPEDLTGAPPAALIPRAQMRAWMGQEIAGNKWLPRYTAAARCPVFHVTPPPPKEDLSALAKPPGAYRGQSVAELGFAPAPRRLALWRLEAQLLSEHLGTLGVTSLPVPPEALTPEGYLAPRYWAADVTHANAAYGALVLRQLRALPHIESAL